jgi:hypothetical protein
VGRVVRRGAGTGELVICPCRARLATCLPPPGLGGAPVSLGGGILPRTGAELYTRRGRGGSDDVACQLRGSRLRSCHAGVSGVN